MENPNSGMTGSRTEIMDPFDPSTTVAAEIADKRSGFTVDRVVRIVVVTISILLVAAALWYFSRLVIYLLVGAILAYSLRPLVDRIQGLGLTRIPAIVITFLLFVGFLSMLAGSLVPFVANQVRELSQLVSVEKISVIAATIEDRLSQVVPVAEGAVIDGVTRVFQTLFQEQGVSSMMGSLVDIFTNLFYAFIIVPFISFFFLKDGPMIRQGVMKAVPNRYYEVTLSVIEKVETNIGRYLQGLLAQCVSIATVASLMLYVVGLDYALAVGVFAGLANTIPYFGPLMGFIAGAVVGIVQSGDFSLIPGVFVAMAITQVADNVFFQPLIFSRVAKAHPLVILFVVLVGAQLGGIVGMLVAIPVTTTIRVMAEQILWSARNYRALKAA